jgi:hypothetical protein
MKVLYEQKGGATTYYRDEDEEDPDLLEIYEKRRSFLIGVSDIDIPITPSIGVKIYKYDPGSPVVYEHNELITTDDHIYSNKNNVLYSTNYIKNYAVLLDGYKYKYRYMLIGMIWCRKIDLKELISPDN